MYNKILIMVPNTITEKSKKYGRYKLSFTNPLCQMGAILNYNKYNVYIKNFIQKNNSLTEDIRYIIKEQFDLICMYTTINLYKSSLVYANEIKKHSTKCKIVLFHRLNDEITIDALNNNIDIVAYGEEDYTLLDIVSGKDLKDIDGISYIDNSNIIYNKPRELINNLDDLPNASYGYELLPIELYSKLYILANRGCLGKCSYCNNCNYNGIRYKNPELVAEEIKYLTTKYNMNRITFADYTFTSNKEYVFSLMDMFDKYNINIGWYCLTRIDNIDMELLQCMKDHGCYSIACGAESIDDNIIGSINKNITKEQIENGVNLCKKIGINLKLHFMIGFPDESTTSIMNNINFCKKIKPEMTTFNIVSPIPGTPLYDYCNNNNLLLTKDWDLYSYYHQIIKLKNIPDYKIEQLQNMAYNLVNDNYINRFTLQKNSKMKDYI